MNEIKETKDRVQVVFDRGHAEVTINVPGFMQVSVSPEKYNEFAQKAWGDEAVLCGDHDRLRVTLDDLSELFGFLTSVFPDLSVLVSSLDDQGKVDVSTPEAMLKYVTTKLVNESVQWSFKDWLLGENGCFGDGIYTAGGAELSGVPEYMDLKVGDRVQITSNKERLATFAAETSPAGKTGVIDRLTWGSWVRVKLSGDRHVYVPQTLVKKAKSNK